MTVLQALDSYYKRMFERGEAPPFGYSSEPISFVVSLSAGGAPLLVRDLREQHGRKLHTPKLIVPTTAANRTSGIMPNLFWDKSAYSLGRTDPAKFKGGKVPRTTEEHAAFCKANLDLLEGSDDPGLVALRRFLENWTPERFDSPPFEKDMLDTNIVFALDGEIRLIHDRPAAKFLLAAQKKDDGDFGFCLVTGNYAPIERLHPSIKGIDDPSSTVPKKLVAFEKDAFTSYGKAQGENAPTSEQAAFRYGTALNRLLTRSEGGGGPNRVSIGDATTVFWADASGAEAEAAAKTAEDIWSSLFAVDDRSKPEDSTEAVKLRDALKLVEKGRAVADLDLGLEPGTRFHILGLSPNAARLSVRFWFSDSFEAFLQRLAHFHHDLNLEPWPWRSPTPNIQWLLVETTALGGKFDNIPPLLAGEVARAVLGGTAYPRSLLAAAIQRLRAGDNAFGRGRHASVIKAVINRSEQEKLPVALNKESTNAAYQLGRLFAVLEAAQYAALGKVNASVADRYYASASSTPARVFGPLLRGLRVHVADAQKRGLGGWINWKVEEIMSHLPDELPHTLRLVDQGRFAVGYYHERNDRPAKADADAHDATEASGKTP